MFRLHILACYIVALSWTVFPVRSQTIIPDGTAGTTVDIVGKTYAITDGSRATANLFHSFEDFGLDAGFVADFQDTVGGGIEHIIGRVTGGSESIIHGQIRSSIPGANLILVNPSGITFSEGASLDVDGSFLSSTADYVGFGPGEPVFSAINPNGPGLSTAPPKAFGFLNDSPAPINVLGAALEVPAGASLGFAGGDLTIAMASLRAPGGRIDLTSVASAGEMQIPAGLANGVDVGSFPRLGLVSVSKNVGAVASVDAGGTGGGSIFVRSGRLVVDDASMFASTTADGPSGLTGAGVDVEVTGQVALAGQSTIGSSVFGGVSQGSGGVRITATSIDLRAGAIIESNTFPASTGSAGPIALAAEHVTILDGGVIRAVTNGTGASGEIHVSGGAVAVADGGFVFSSTQGTGDAGKIEVDADSVALSTASAFTAITGRTFGEGSAGLVQVTTSDLNIAAGTEVSSVTFGPGAGNDVTISAKNGVLDMLVSGGGVFTNAFGTGAGGSIDVGSADVPATKVRVDNRGSMEARGLWFGPSGRLSIHTDRLEVADGALLNTSTLGFFGFGPARPGDVAIVADSVLLDGFDGAADPALSDATGIFSFGTQGSGDVRLTVTDTLTLTDQARVNVSTFGAGAGGVAILDAGRLEVLRGAAVIANSFGSGRGGTIDVKADEVVIAGVHPEPFIDGFTGLELLAVSAIGVQSQSSGAAGEIRVDTDTLEVLDGARISSETFSTGAGGAIRINSESTVVAGVNVDHEAFWLAKGLPEVEARSNASSAIIASAVPLLADTTGPGGIIEIDSGTLALRDHGLILSRTGGNAPGGSIEVSADALTLAGEAEIGADTTSTGNGGNITFDVGELTLREGALVNANTAAEGTGGSIVIHARDVVSLSGIGTSGRASAISTDSESVAAEGGAAGSIEVEARSVLVQDGAMIRGNTAGGGIGGGIAITATEDVVISGVHSTVSTESTSNTPHAGNAGDIRVEARDVTIGDGGQVSTRATSADGGDVKLDVAVTLFLNNGQITTSVGTGEGSGGNIDIDPIFVILRMSSINANAFGGSGGNIRIVTDFLFLDEFSSITASSERSVQGTIEIVAPDNDLTGTLAVLQSEYLDAASRLAQGCEARGGVVRASLVSEGRGGLPVPPGGPIASHYAPETPAGLSADAGVPPGDSQSGGAGALVSLPVQLYCTG